MQFRFSYVCRAAPPAQRLDGVSLALSTWDASSALTVDTYIGWELSDSIRILTMGIIEEAWPALDADQRLEAIAGLEAQHTWSAPTTATWRNS